MLLLLMLTLNNSIFNGLHYLQKMECALDNTCAPNYANVLMWKFGRAEISS